jgi:phage shock protein A
MGLFKRMSMIFRSKTNRVLDRVEDPRQTLDYSYQRQLELLQKVRRGVADVATSRKRLELQLDQLQRQSDKLTNQAQQALALAREDLAREALTRKSGLAQQLSDLQQQHASLQGEEEKLTLAAQRLQARVESFRTRKEAIKATYTAAEAQTKIGEAFSGISDEMSDVGLAIQRAEDKTATLQARAGAIDELLASGALDDPSGMARDDITAELDRMASTSDVEHELARMKQQLGAGAAPAELEAETAPAIEAQPTASPTPESADDGTPRSAPQAPSAQSQSAQPVPPPQPVQPAQPQPGDQP